MTSTTPAPVRPTDPTPSGAGHPSAGAATTVEMWFDPICPWAWVTSRWLGEVAEARGLRVHWQVMSLSLINEHRELSESYRSRMDAAWAPVRVLTAARLAHGDEVVKPLYDAIGRRVHVAGRKHEHPAVLAEALTEVGLPADLLDAAGSDAHDDALRASHAAATDRLGEEIGTPVVAVDGVGFFGPVVTAAPTGPDALRMWDGLVLLAGVPGFSEIRRARGGSPTFG